MNLYYYKLNNKYAISLLDMETLSADLPKGTALSFTKEDELASCSENIFLLTQCTPGASRKSFLINDASQLFITKEDITLLKKGEDNREDYAPWLLKAVDDKRVISINISYENWYDALMSTYSKVTPVKKEFKPVIDENGQCCSKRKLQVVGLGDVGGILCSGLRLLGCDSISSIGLFDKDENKIERWYYECGQICGPDTLAHYPEIIKLKVEELFQCDMFIFCVSVGVPEVGKETQDVRLVQFNGNAKIVSYYAKLAREKGFKGIFAVVSDPVDLLCRAAYDASNKNEHGQYDYKGLSPEQVRGYGLGVMNARAAFFSSQNEKFHEYKRDGRAFGPHGEGLIIANSMENFNLEASLELTKLTREANLRVREAGFKPYIAPALSSGALSLIATLKGDWHYSATMLGSAFFGCRNRLTDKGVEVESFSMPAELLKLLQETYEMLVSLYNKRINI